MENIIIGMIIISTVITAIVNFAKPAYEQFVGKRAVTINIWLSFILWVATAFAIAPYIDLEIWAWAKILIWLALGTGSTLFYDIWRLIQNLGSTKKDNVVETPTESIGYDLSDKWEGNE